MRARVLRWLAAKPADPLLVLSFRSIAAFLKRQGIQVVMRVVGQFSQTVPQVSEPGTNRIVTGQRQFMGIIQFYHLRACSRVAKFSG
jgi:hypothetical protein